MVLTALAIAHLAASCGAPPRRISRIEAHAWVESHREVFAIHDNKTGRRYLPASKAAAIALAGRLVAEGHSIDAGLMQLNVGNWPAFGLTAATVFDTRRNVCAGAAVIAWAYGREARVSCIYNTGHPNCPPGYPMAIAAEIARETRRARDQAPTEVAELPPARKPPNVRLGGIFVTNDTSTPSGTSLFIHGE